MIKKSIYFFIIILFLFLFSITTIKISDEPIITNTLITSQKQEIGKIIIEKINLQKNLYDINNPQNSVEKNVTILKESTPPTKKNSIMILAAHSGTGKIAYFNSLNKLELNDSIILIYKNKKYTYIVKNIWEEPKTGYINFNKEKDKQLILTTCSPTNSKNQLVINCIEKTT